MTLCTQNVDGYHQRTGSTAVIELHGAARSILKAERVALNFLQRLCGIATLTRQFVDAIGNHPAKILDTRKPTPGLRALEKAAVVAGGGVNHRFGLYDMVLVKDNHLAALGGLSEFADRIRQFRKERPDIVHAYLPSSNVLGPIAAERSSASSWPAARSGGTSIRGWLRAAAASGVPGSIVSS